MSNKLKQMNDRLSLQGRVIRLEKMYNDMQIPLRNAVLTIMVLEQKGLITNAEINEKYTALIKASQVPTPAMPIQSESPGKVVSAGRDSNPGVPTSEGGSGTLTPPTCGSGVVGSTQDDQNRDPVTNPAVG
jgi:hypothetical protein